MSDLQLYSVMPLDENHIDEICEDIKNQYKSGIANFPVFCMTLMPEGNPPVNKAKNLCEKYIKFKSKLDSEKIPSGVLVQASIGHGWVLGEESEFQKLVQFTDGTSVSTVCPYDEGFKKYIYDALKTIAKCNPGYIMIDDDLRLIFREGEGCACPLHLKRISEIYGKTLTREQLRKLVAEGNKHLQDIFIRTQKEAVVEVAKIMRSAIDSVNPKIPGSFCCVGANAEFAVEIATVLAGEGNPVVVRINNGNYTAVGAKQLSNVFYRAATQIEKIKKHTDVILDESDTCPQNRYSTSASMVHAHFAGTILEGANGAKHWITKLNSFEPESGVAYRNILKKYKGFYEELAKTVPLLSWKGCRIPLLGEAKYVFDGKKYPGPGIGHWGAVAESPNGWANCVLERLGLPVYFSSENSGIVCLEGNCDEYFTDEQMLKALGGCMFVASDSAKKLIDRGFGKYLGVDVKEWDGKQPTDEIVFVNNNYCKAQVGFKQLIPLSESVIEHSKVIHSLDGKNIEYLFPGVTEYKNDLGGTVFVFCGTPNTKYDLSTAFSYLCYSRKLQLTELMKKSGHLPAYYPGDEEVYFRCATTDKDEIFVAMFNISFDKIEKTKIVCHSNVSKIEMLMPGGNWIDVCYEKQGDEYIIDAPCEILIPLVLKFV